MRHTLKRAVLLLIVAAIALGPLAACGKDPYYEFDDGEKDRIETDTGTELQLGAVLRTPKTPGCACTSDKEGFDSEPISSVDYSVEPAEGATVSDAGVFTATRPGTYRVMVSGSYGSATTTVVVTGDQLPEEDGPPVESEEPEADPFVGSWMWTPWWPQQKSGVAGNLTPDEFDWVPGTSQVELVISGSDGAFTAGGWVRPGTTVTVNGTSVVVGMTYAEGSCTLAGTLSGDTITGTQTWTDQYAGTKSAEWVATRVK